MKKISIFLSSLLLSNLAFANQPLTIEKVRNQQQINGDISIVNSQKNEEELTVKTTQIKAEEIENNARNVVVQRPTKQNARNPYENSRNVINSKESSKNNFYFGLDFVRSQSKHKFEVRSNTVDVYPEYPDSYPDYSASDDSGTMSNGGGSGVGVNLGYKIKIYDAFLAPEIFYDHLHNQSFSGLLKVNNNRIGRGQDTATLEYRYGAKLNLGYNFGSFLDLFVTAGISSIRYDVDLNSIDASNNYSLRSSRGGHKIAPLYGAGFALHLNQNWDFKMTYDRQDFNIQYVFEGLRDKVKLEVVKAGLVYNF